MSRFPYGLPDGWFAVAYSDEIAPGTVRRARYFERELAIFRTLTGRVAVLDAHCPHLGAHLAEGGTVVGETLECPLHGRRFDADGACVAVPYASSAHPGTRARALPVRESGGLVLVWHHADGASPDYEVPPPAEWHAADWTTTYERRTWRVRTHPQEVMESFIDWPHYARVHAMPAPQERSYSFDGRSFSWAIGASALADNLDARRPNYLMQAQGWGLGLSWVRYAGLYKLLTLTAATPVDRDTLELRFGAITKLDGRSETEARDALQAYVTDQAKAMEQDIRIWESKAHRPNPPLCDADGPIDEFRRWAATFYSPTESVAQG
jgi:3-ketosteroid 9alpha-monooxygenase subunit A